MNSRAAKGVDYTQVEHLFGKQTDASIAHMLGIDASNISRQRKRRGIPRYVPAHGHPAASDPFRHPPSFEVPPHPPTLRSVRQPTLQPPSPAATTTAQEHRILFVPDTHAPYHDTAAFRCMLAAAQFWRPTALVVLGDFADLYCVSRYPKRPERKQQIADEICGVRDALDQLDALGVAHKYYVMGNHEARLSHYIGRNSPAFDGLFDVESLLSLHERGWQVTPYGEGRQIGELFVTHDLDIAGKYAVRRSMDHAWSSCVIGHTHRLETVWQADGRGNGVVGASFGWLGDFEAIDYAKRKIVQRQWRHGFGLCYMDAQGRADVVAVPVQRGRCRVEGTVIRAEDYQGQRAA